MSAATAAAAGPGSAMPPVTDDDMPVVEMGTWQAETYRDRRATRVFTVFAAPDTGTAGADRGGADRGQADREQLAQLPDEVTSAVDPARIDASVGAITGGLASGTPWLVVGLGEPGAADVDTGFAAAAAASIRARETGTRTLLWQVDPGVADPVLTGIVQGFQSAAHTPDRYRSARTDPLSLLVLDDPRGRAQLVAEAAVVGRACQHTRDLQNAPANLLTPAALAARAQDLAAAHPHLTATVLDEQEIRRRGMGAFAAVARGSAESARLVELSYDPPDATGPRLGWVGKGVTFDSGGTNLKHGPGITEMKFDMSGAAAVIEAVAAVAALGLPVRVVGVAGATENMPGGAATKPGDIVRTLDGTTVEITNTDAEGRLVLADCLTYTRGLGVEALVDVATLTGSVVTMFDGRYGALMSNDDAWADLVTRAGETSGDRVWRMPLHPWYAGRLRGRYSDIINCRADNGAGTVIAGEFLHRFAGDVPWAHVDALAWDLPYQDGLEGGAAYGVRLLVEIARTVGAR